MKRAAEKQLIKDDDDEGVEDEIEEVSSGFKKADESVLASRPMRALPRRSVATPASSAPLSVPEPTPTGKFVGFSGFGSGATSNPFSTPSVPPGAPKLASAVPLSLSGTTTSSQPSVASSASNATKTFASIVSYSSTSSEPASSPASVIGLDDDQSEIEYYKALRGLNVSFLTAVSKAIESDPFVDVAELLERYKSLRISVKTDYEDKSKPSQKSAAATSSSASPTSTTSEPPKPAAPLPTFTMPKPPSSFSGFKIPATSSSSVSSTGGFVPKMDLASTSNLGSPFNFSASKPPAAESMTTDTPKSTFTFGSSTSAPSGATSSPFSFAAPASGSSLFGKPSSGISSSTSAPSIFGSGSSTTSPFGATFGKSSDTESSKDHEKAKDTEKPASTPSLSFFGSGSSTTTAFGSNGAATTTDKEKDKSTPFSFGSASPGGVSVFGGFGPKAGSLGNPVGFGFGSPPKTPGVDGAQGPVTSLPFSFAPKPAATEEKETESEEGSSSTEGMGTPVPEQPAAPLFATTSVHDREGEGEEEEETVHEIRSKVYKMLKDKDGNAQWTDVGVGMLRLKKHKTTDARRMLLRNSSTGKITINFMLYAGMNPTLLDKVVSFIGHEQGAATPYRIRMKTPDQASSLKAALDREIALVKDKSDA